MSSRYTRQTLQGNPTSTSSINLSKVAGALHSPKGMTTNCHNPLPVVKAVFSLSSSCNSTCQYSLLRSSVENQLEPANASKVVSIRGKGYESFLVISLSFL